MGVLNVTPDSFSDAGMHFDKDAAIARARSMRDEGADVIDVGGESTRPGATPVSEEEEARRILPVIHALAKEGFAISVDTRKPVIALAAINAGACVINDVAGFRDPEMLAVANKTGATICIMHMQGEPQTMQQNTDYENVVNEVLAWLLQQAQAAIAAGIARESIWLDPGLGFGKTAQQSTDLLRYTRLFADTGFPILIGASRKSFLGKLAAQPDPAQRVGASLAAAIFSVQSGAKIVRVHDVAQTKQALDIWLSLTGSAG